MEEDNDVPLESARSSKMLISHRRTTSTKPTLANFLPKEMQKKSETNLKLPPINLGMLGKGSSLQTINSVYNT